MDAGFWSSSRSFFLPLGPRLDPAGLGGFAIDMRVKATSTAWPPPGVSLHNLYVTVAQYGLGAHERWLAGDGEQWLAAALRAAEHLCDCQESSGAWLHHRPFAHTFPVRAPWCSAIAQGEAASLLVRMHAHTGEERFAQAALLAIAPLRRSLAEGGVGDRLGGGVWFEEYPCSPASHVLNGAIFALWGLRDVAVALREREAHALFVEGVDSLVANLHRYDTGRWSLYSLFPHPVPNVASSFYHDLHVNQLEATNRLAPRPQLAAARDRFAAYAASARLRRRAFADKVAFRLLVPRNRHLARRLPWTRW
jgi:heparosan-N-sulfate-glucuronate 5-epimerase